MRRLAGLIAIGAFATIACGGPGASTPTDTRTFEIRAIHGLTTDHPYYAGFTTFKQVVESESKGRIKVTIVVDTNQASEAANVEQVRSGGFQLAEAANGLLSSTYKKPIMQAWSLPFLYSDAASAGKAWDSAYAAKSFATYDDQGFKCIARWDAGFRELSANKSVTSPADLKGLKVRTPTGSVYLDTWNALGAQPVGLAFSELYTSLQTGVVNGSELPLPVMVSSKFYEVQKYQMITNYLNDPICLNLSGSLYNSLPGDLKKAVDKAALASAKAERAETQKQTDAAAATLKSHGMTIVNPDLKAFQAAVKPVYDKYTASQGSDGQTALDSIRKVAGS